MEELSKTRSLHI